MVPAERPAPLPPASLSKPPVKILGRPVGRVTAKLSAFVDVAVWAFVAAYVSLKLTVKISPTLRARWSVAKRPFCDD